VRQLASKGSSALHILSVNTGVDMEGECHSPMLSTVVADLGH
jgi:hypothetical protein